MRNDLMEGIEGKDVITETMRGTRNALVALWHGLQGIIPSIANSMNGQKFNVVSRNGGLHGTTNAIRKIFETKGILGKASAIFAEATDGPVDDALHIAGGAEWIIEPSHSTTAMADTAISSEGSPANIDAPMPAKRIPEPSNFARKKFETDFSIAG